MNNNQFSIPFIRLGEGSFGIIFEQPGAGHIHPAPHPVERLAEARSRRSEPDQDGLRPRPRRPHPRVLAYRTDFAHWWTVNDPLFPVLQATDYRTPDHILIADRIPPIPASLRARLIETYCPPDLQPEARVSTRHCLARIYLGRRREARPLSSLRSAFSLTNFQGTVDRLEALGFDTQALARQLADALAVMHWDAGVDAKDVEFVLGGASATPCVQWVDVRALRDAQVLEVPDEEPMPETRSVATWLLDFDKVGFITHDGAGVQRAVAMFWQNDAYYPRPHKEGADEVLWQVFRERYLGTASRILGQESNLPGEFIDGVEKWDKVPIEER